MDNSEYIRLKEIVWQAFKGGEGSGNFGHAGRPGEVGGSASPLNGQRSSFIDSIQNHRTEVGGLFDKDGNLLEKYDTGYAHSVDVPENVRNELVGKEFIHNHPSGQTFSENDVKFALRYKLSAITAVDDKYIYRLKLNWNDGEYNANNIPEWSVNSIENFINKSFGKYSDLFYSGKMTLKDANVEASNEGLINWINSNSGFKNSFEYTRSKR